MAVSATAVAIPHRAATSSYPPIFYTSLEDLQRRLFAGKGDPGVGVGGGGEHAGEEVGKAEHHAGGVDAGMAGVEVAVAELLVDDKAHAAVAVVDEAQGGDGAGMDVEIVGHMLLVGEGEAGAAEL